MRDLRNQWRLAMSVLCLLVVGAMQYIAPATVAAADDPALDRTSLPVAEPVPPTITEVDARKAKAPPILAPINRRDRAGDSFYAR